jgi:hypothetical protein
MHILKNLFLDKYLQITKLQLASAGQGPRNLEVGGSAL